MTVEMRTRVWVGLFVLVVFLAGLGAGIVASPWLGFGPRAGFGPGRGTDACWSGWRRGSI